MSVLDELNKRGIGTLPGLIGLEVKEAEEGGVSSRLDLREELMAPNGYLHAATVVALADTSCGTGPS
jgi:1,4-dihydroxy-2-naphthoyl-CoA hydrolase